MNEKYQLFLINSESNIVIEKLLNKFNNLRWETNVDNIKDFNYKKLPPIYFSPDKRILKDPITNIQLDEKKPECIDLMGEYRTDNTDIQEGYIVLYYNTIIKVADKFIKDNKNIREEIINREEIIKRLIMIVLIHELIHWIMHWIKDPLNKQFIPFLYNSNEEVLFHEQFAQWFTYLTIKSETNIVELFNWLETKQPDQYKIEKLKGKDEEIAFYILLLCRKEQNQTYHFLKENLTVDLNDAKEFNDKIKENCIPLDEWEKSELSINDFIHKYRGEISGKKFGF